jgi:hypothetical protein
MLYLIDPYKVYVEEGQILSEFVGHHDIAKKTLASYSKKITFVKEYSSEASKEIPNDLDFVYIDGDHSYEKVKSDCEIYFNKVRSGGVLGGHDLIAKCLGVCLAVVEFANQHNLKRA